MLVSVLSKLAGGTVGQPRVAVLAVARLLAALRDVHCTEQEKLLILLSLKTFPEKPLPPTLT